MDATRVIIVDDEEGARESLSNLLEKYVDNVKVVAKSENIASGLEKITKYTPELVFLDIEMPFGSGFELLERMKPVNFNIIFVTAYDHYALKAIKFSALDYLLKPVDIDELRTAVKKHQLESGNKSEASYNNLLENLKADDQEKKLAIPDSHGITFLKINDIIRCESDGNYTRIFMKEGKPILASKTLGEYEHLLEGESFFRVHRSHLVNLMHIKKYLKGDGSYIVLSDDTKVDVSRRKKSAFLEVLNQFNHWDAV
ncbi:MAG: response regulator transcription factor [Flavobacteriales bacterium]|nr:response regulator transcription factor [Flavobacteriales bacterium]